MANDPVPVPQESTADGVHAWTKTALTLIPLGSDLFQMLVQPPIEKRRKEWMNDVGERLRQLEIEKGVVLEDLQQDEQFLSVVMHASTIAIKNHQEEKLEALRNAIINVAKGQAPEDALLHMYLHLVDELSVLQIQILEALMHPKPPSNLFMGSLSSVLEHMMPRLKGKSEIVQRLFKDLAAKGLVEGSLQGSISGQGLAERSTTFLGTGFMCFISP